MIHTMTPVSYTHLVYVDPMDVQYNGAQSTAEFTYIKRPAKFAIGINCFRNIFVNV